MADAPAASGALAWGPAIALTGPRAEHPQAVMDARGDALAVWLEVDPGGSTIVYAWRPARGAWQAPRALGPGSAPKVVVTPRGEGLCTWVAPDHTVHVAVAPLLGAFGADQTLSRPGDASTPALASDDAGDAVVAWLLAFSGPGGVPGHAVQVALRRGRARFSPPVTVEPDSAGSPPAVAMNAAGAAVTAWAQTSGAVQLAYRPPAGSFEPVEPVPLPAARRPLAAVDAAGDAVIAVPTGTQGAAAVGRDVQGHYGAARTVDLGGGLDAMLAEPGGALTFVSEQPDASAFTLALTSALPTGTLIGPQAISSPGSCFGDVAMDTLGATLGAWTNACRGSDQPPTVVVADRPPGARFGPEVGLSGPDAREPDGARDEQGDAVVAWTRNSTPGDPDTSLVEAAVRESPGATPGAFPPTVRIQPSGRPSLAGTRSLAVNVTCDRVCRVTPSVLLHTPSLTAAPAPVRTVRVPAGRRVVLRFRFSARVAAAVASAIRRGEDAWVGVSATAAGGTLRTFTRTQRIALRG